MGYLLRARISRKRVVDGCGQEKALFVEAEIEAAQREAEIRRYLLEHATRWL